MWSLRHTYHHSNTELHTTRDDTDIAFTFYRGDEVYTNQYYYRNIGQQLGYYEKDLSSRLCRVLNDPPGIYRLPTCVRLSYDSLTLDLFLPGSEKLESGLVTYLLSHQKYGAIIPVIEDPPPYQEDKPPPYSD